MEKGLRKTTIKRYLEGEPPKLIYTDLKRSKYWFFKWLRRYQSGDLDWYKDRQGHLRDDRQRLAVLKEIGSYPLGDTLSHKNLLKLAHQPLNGS